MTGGEPDHAVIGDLLADTVYAAGREADRGMHYKSKESVHRNGNEEDAVDGNENEELKGYHGGGFPVLEHTGGDGWTILHGDRLSIVRAFKPGACSIGDHRPALCQRAVQSPARKPDDHRNIAACARTRRCRILDGDQRRPAELDALDGGMAERCAQSPQGRGCAVRVH